MLPQFIYQDPRVLAVVYRDRDQLHAALLKSPLERRRQPLGGLDPGTAGVMSAGERDEIRCAFHARRQRALRPLREWGARHMKRISGLSTPFLPAE
jgi:hypothetical protein